MESGKTTEKQLNMFIHALTKFHSKRDDTKQAIPARDSVPAHISLEAKILVVQVGAAQRNSSSVRHSLATLIPVVCQSP